MIRLNMLSYRLLGVGSYHLPLEMTEEGTRERSLFL